MKTKVTTFQEESLQVLISEVNKFLKNEEIEYVNSHYDFKITDTNEYHENHIMIIFYQDDDNAIKEGEVFWP